MRRALALVLLLAGCTASQVGIKPEKIGHYEQTWQTPYSRTSCFLWLNRMTRHQRFVASHDFIISLKAYDTSDRFARSFVRDISKACQPAEGLAVTEIAAAIATTATRDFR